MKKIIPQTLLTLPILATGLQAQEKQTPPNLVFIMADQYRGDAMGCIGKEPVQTPSLDQLAAEGINFTNADSGYPVSSPARGMLMTGMYLCVGRNLGGGLVIHYGVLMYWVEHSLVRV